MTYIVSLPPYVIHIVNVGTVSHNVSHHIYTDLLVLDIIRKECELQGITMPRHLIRNEDNTCSENKAKMKILWDLLCVNEGMWDHVTHHYFDVGHTHWKCDQLFAVFAQALRKQLHGIPNIHHFLKVCFFHVIYFICNNFPCHIFHL